MCSFGGFPFGEFFKKGLIGGRLSVAVIHGGIWVISRVTSSGSGWQRFGSNLISNLSQSREVGTGLRSRGDLFGGELRRRRRASGELRRTRVALFGGP